MDCHRVESHPEALAQLDADVLERTTHSFRKASTGFRRAARQAGKNPESTPVNSETNSATATTVKDMRAGKNLAKTKVKGYAMARASKPLKRQIDAASVRNWSRI